MSELIDTLGVAQLLGLTRDYTTDRVTKRPDFPKPRIAISQKTKRWDRAEVERWAMSPNATSPKAKPSRD